MVKSAEEGSASRRREWPKLPDVDTVAHRTPEERHARGVAARRMVPLDSHADWRPALRRADPVEILEQQSSVRDPDLIPIRYGRMLASTFAFFRGTAAIMASDLAGTAVSGLRAQLCGDAHLVNFGIFQTPERSLLFDINDFDETTPGPWEWDVKRLAASFEVAGRDLRLKRKDRRRAVRRAVRAYREAMAGFAEQTNLEVWYASLGVDVLERFARGGGHAKSRKPLKKAVRRALHHNRVTAFEKFLEERDGGLRFVRRPPLIVPIEELLDADQRPRYAEVVSEFLDQYRNSLRPDRRHLLETYRYVHLARKVVGVGSVGARAWVVLLVGRDQGDPLLLQLKEAGASVLEPYAGPNPYEHPGRRVVEGQRLMQAASDSLLGWYRLRAFDEHTHSFYVRQLWDGKASIDVSSLNAKSLCDYADACGWTLARAHARSGDRIAIAAYLGDTDAFDRAIADFAAVYGDVTEEDHAALVAAAEAGDVAVQTGI